MSDPGAEAFEEEMFRMNWVRSPSLGHWSTDVVPPSQRFDYYADALSSAQTPMSVWSDNPDAFAAQMEAIDLGPMAVFRQRGSGNRAHRSPHDVRRSTERSFHLLVNRTSGWTLDHRSRIRLSAGDAVLTDSSLGHDLDIPGDYEFVHVKFTDTWLHRWLPSPEALIGRRIPVDAGWGRTFAAFAANLTPAFFARSPLPLPLLGDHLGALLTMLARDAGVEPLRATKAEAGLAKRICDDIHARCTDPRLDVQAVADTLRLSTRTVHRSLAAAGLTFMGVLLSARVQVARRMLEAPLFRRLTVGEIGQRAGFVDASHFTRVFRARTGHTPSQLRPPSGPDAADIQQTPS